MSERGALVRLRREVDADVQAASRLFAALSGYEATLPDLHDPVPLGYVAVTLHQVYTGLETAFVAGEA